MEGRNIQRKAFLQRIGGLVLGFGILGLLRGKHQKVSPAEAVAANNPKKLQVQRDERAVAQQV